MEITELRRRKLKQWIDEKFDGVQARFVDETGINQGELSALLKNKSFGEKKARQLEITAGMPAHFLDRQDNDETPEIKTYQELKKVDIPTTGRDLPLLGSVQAGHWQTADNFHEIDVWRTTRRKCSPKSFALVVSGYSMQNPGQRESFDPGDIILIDPEMPYNNGSLVIAITDDGDATFKKLFIEDGRYFLKALNPDWTPNIQAISRPTQIHGVIFEKQVDF